MSLLYDYQYLHVSQSNHSMNHLPPLLFQDICIVYLHDRSIHGLFFHTDGVGSYSQCLHSCMDTKCIHLLSPCIDYGHLSTSLDRQDSVFDSYNMMNTVYADYHTGILVGQCIPNRLDIQEWIKCLCCLPCITAISEKCRKQVRSHT